MKHGKVQRAIRHPGGRVYLIFAVGIEELVMEMKKKYNMAIVTHNMQQATRIWDSAAFFFPEEMAGFDVAGRVFSMPRDQRNEDYNTGRFG